MAKTPRVLIAGESWTVHSIHQKGFDSFTTTEYAEGVGWLKRNLDTVTHGFAVQFLFHFREDVVVSAVQITHGIGARFEDCAVAVAQFVGHADDAIHGDLHAEFQSYLSDLLDDVEYLGRMALSGNAVLHVA